MPLASLAGGTAPLGAGPSGPAVASAGPSTGPAAGTGAARLAQLASWQRRSVARSLKKRPPAVGAGPAATAAPTPAPGPEQVAVRPRSKVPDTVIRRKARLMVAGALLHAKVPDAALALPADAATSPVAGVSLTALRLAMAVAGEAEAAMHAAHPLNTARQAYRQQLLAITSNLNDASNPGLRKRVLSGDIKGARLGGMSSQEMASRERKAERSALVEEEVQRANKNAVAEESKARPDEHASQPNMHLGSSAAAAAAGSGGAREDDAQAAGGKAVFGKKASEAAAKSSVLTQLVSRQGEGGAADDSAAEAVAAAEAAAAAERSAALAALAGAQVLSRAMPCSVKLQAPPKGVPEDISLQAQHAKWVGVPGDSVSAAVGAAFGAPASAGASLFTDVRGRWGLGDVVDNGAAAKLRLAQFPTDVLQAGRMKLPALAAYLLEVHSKMRLSSRVAGALHVTAPGDSAPFTALCRSLASAQRALVLEVPPGGTPAHPKGDWQWYLLPPLTHLAAGAAGSSLSLARAGALPADVRGLYWLLMSGYGASPREPLAVLVMRKPKPPKSATRTSSSHSKGVFGSRASSKRPSSAEWSAASGGPASKAPRAEAAAAPHSTAQPAVAAAPYGAAGGSSLFPTAAAVPGVSSGYDPYAAPAPQPATSAAADPYAAPAQASAPAAHSSTADPYAAAPAPAPAPAPAGGVSRLAGLAAALASIPGGGAGGGAPPGPPPISAFGQRPVYPQPTSSAQGAVSLLGGGPPIARGGAFGQGTGARQPPVGRFPGATTPAWATKGAHQR